jgi:hypothetical protein
LPRRIGPSAWSPSSRTGQGKPHSSGTRPLHPRGLGPVTAGA